MNMDALPLNALAPDACPPLAGKRNAGHTLTLRLRFAGARLREDAMAGTISLEDGGDAATGALHAAVLDAPAKALTITM